MYGRAQAPGCGLRHRKGAGNWRTCARPAAGRTCQEPAPQTPAPWPVELTKGEHGRGRTATDCPLRPGQLARWAEGPGAALGAGRCRLEKRSGSVAGPRKLPRSSARPGSAARCALGLRGRGNRTRPPPGACLAADRQALPAPTWLLLFPAPWLRRERDPRMGVGTAGALSDHTLQSWARHNLGCWGTFRLPGTETT